MPVASREASIYSGMTIAEYYRDMGYNVLLLADSTSRWAEALREIAGRLEEMPAEEGFPAYLSSRLAGFYERAGRVKTLSDQQGSITVIGAVSPQSGDFSEPVTQNSKRFTRCFWALSRSLAAARHFPAIHCSDSYSEYGQALADWYGENLGEGFLQNAARLRALLQKEREFMEIVRLIGADVLPDEQKLIVRIARVFRQGYLQQNAFQREDAYTPIAVQKKLLEAIFHLYDRALELIARGIPLSEFSASGIFDAAIRLKGELVHQPERGETFRAAVDRATADLLEKHQ